MILTSNVQGESSPILFKKPLGVNVNNNSLFSNGTVDSRTKSEGVSVLKKTAK